MTRRKEDLNTYGRRKGRVGKELDHDPFAGGKEEEGREGRK